MCLPTPERSRIETFQSRWHGHGFRTLSGGEFIVLLFEDDYDDGLISSSLRDFFRYGKLVGESIKDLGS